MKILVISAALFGLSFASCSQDVETNKVPSVVVNALQAKYASATGVDWEKTKSGYEAELIWDSTEVTTLIDPSGKILAQKWDIGSNQLPPAVLAFVAQQYNSYKIDDAEKVEKEGAVYYQVELDKRWKKDVQLVFNAEGTLQQNGAFWE